MNILLNMKSTIDQVLLDELVSLPETSIYLSLSTDETMRILAEIRPLIIITDRKTFLAGLMSDLPLSRDDLELYYYEKIGDNLGNYLLTPYSKTNVSNIGFLDLEESTIPSRISLNHKSAYRKQVSQK